MQLLHYAKFGNIPCNQTPSNGLPLLPIYIFSTDTIERGANAVGMINIILPPATTERRDRERSLISQPYKALFYMEGGGSPGGGGITQNLIYNFLFSIVN